LDLFDLFDTAGATTFDRIERLSLGFEFIEKSLRQPTAASSGQGRKDGTCSCGTACQDACGSTCGGGDEQNQTRGRLACQQPDAGRNNGAGYNGWGSQDQTGRTAA